METIEFCDPIAAKNALSSWTDPCDPRPEWEQQSYSRVLAIRLYHDTPLRKQVKEEIASFRYAPVSEQRPQREVAPDAIKVVNRVDAPASKRLSLREAGELAVAILLDAEAARAKYADEEAVKGFQFEP